MEGITSRVELDAVLLAGRDSLSGGAYEEAARLLRLADDSTFLDAAERARLWLEIGTAAEGAGSPHAAARYYEAAVKSGNASVAVAATERLGRLRQLDMASSRTGDQFSPDRMHASELSAVKRAAVSAFYRRDYTVAADFFRQLLDEPYVPVATNAEISYNLGQCLLQMQDYDGARYHLDQAAGKSTVDINQRTQALLQRLERLDDALANVEPHLAP